MDADRLWEALAMEFGICLASRPRDLGHVVTAERLGFTHCWMADSQMIWSDVYAMLALAAERTTSMQIGTGVAVAPTRPAVVTAAAHATINELAPGRVFCGIGTGNTAMRIMGHKPMPIAEFDDYLGTLRALMAGEEADVVFRGRAAPARHVMPDDGFVRFDPPIPIHVSAFGPRAMGLAAKHGDGLITSAPPQPAAIERVRAGLAAAAAEAGRSIDRETFPVSTLTTTCVLRPGETLESPRVREQTGAFAIAGLHYTYEQVTQLGRPVPKHVADIWDDYAAALEEIPEERRHLRTHLGHNCWVTPEEERFVTPALIDASCIVGSPDQVRCRIAELDAAGLDQLVILPPIDEKEAVVADIARHLM